MCAEFWVHTCAYTHFSSVILRYTVSVNLFNKTFYKFFLSFLSVVGVVLISVLIIGLGS